MDNIDGLEISGKLWRDLSVEEVAGKLHSAVAEAMEDPTAELIASSVLWYRRLLMLLDDPDDLDQLWKKLVQQQALPAEWPLWQRCANQFWAKNLHY